MTGNKTNALKVKRSSIRSFNKNLDNVMTWRFWSVQAALMSIWMIYYFAVLNRELFIGGPVGWLSGFSSVFFMIVVNIMVNILFPKQKNWLIYWINLLWVGLIVFCLAESSIDYLLYREFAWELDEFMIEAPERKYFNIISLYFVYEFFKVLILSFISSLFYRFLYDKATGEIKQNEPSILSQTTMVLISMAIIIFSFAYTTQSIIELSKHHQSEEDFIQSSLIKVSEINGETNTNETQDLIQDDLQNNIPKPQYDEDYSIYVDFSQSSDKKRFVVVDNKKQKVIATSKCAHGAGKGSTIDTPVFSNEIGSNCSSLGKYKVAEISKMNNGFPCIRLDGLSKTNSNARNRGIVIHELPILTDPAFDTMKIPLNEFISSGCFSISPEVFNLLKELRSDGKTMYVYATCG